MLVAGGDYEASLLLFDNLWVSGTFPVNGDYVIAVPTKDVLLITGLNDSLGIEKLRKNVAGADTTYPSVLSKALFIRRNGSWDIFEPPAVQLDH